MTRASYSIAPSPLYSGERVGVRGELLSPGGKRISTPGPSPQPSPPSTEEREPNPATIIAWNDTTKQSTAFAQFSIAKTQRRKDAKKFKFSSLRLCVLA